VGPTLCVSSAWDECVLESMDLSCPHVYLGSYFGGINGIRLVMGSCQSGNACYHSVQNLLSSSLLSKYLKIKIYRTITLPVVLYGRENWSLTLR